MTGGSAGAGGVPSADAGTPSIASGLACTKDIACKSGHCTEGVCCNSSCGDRFFSCNLDGHVGACTAMSSVYIDPLNGRDDATGTVDDPVKTLKTALTYAKSGWTLYLKPGTFGKSSGEDWSTKVPNGVAVQAVVEGNAVLVGGDQDIGLEFAGSGTATGITFRGFKNAMRAAAGKVSIARCTVDGGGGVSLSGNVTATLDQVVLGNLESDGVSAFGSANVTMTGGSIGGVGYIPDCRGAQGVTATAAAIVHLSAVNIHDLGADGVIASGSAAITIDDGAIVKTGQSDCTGAQVSALDSSLVQLKGTSVTHGNSVGAYVRDLANLALDGVSVEEHPDAGVKGEGGMVRITDSLIEANVGGVELLGTCGAQLSGASLASNLTSVFMQDTTSLKLRSTKLYDDVVGIEDIADGLHLDLGTADDPGMNSFLASDDVLNLPGSSVDVTVNAVGNTWNADVQGADGAGAYASQIIDGPCDGANFFVGGTNIHIQL
jgi:hypothetical protein